MLGDGSGPPLGIKLTDKAAELELVFNPALKFGELFMDGRLLVTKGDLYEVIDFGARRIAELQGANWVQAIDRMRIAVRRVHQRNDRRRARANIAHHYDLDRNFYRLFLDSDLQYSCAYFEHEGATLEEAQLAKKRHIVAKMLVEAGQTVLDIGCGFGGMALYLAGVAGAKATGVTLSEEQVAVAKERAQAPALPTGSISGCRTIVTSGRHSTASSRSACSSMSGSIAFDEYFRKVKTLLKDDGVMLLHSIGPDSAAQGTVSCGHSS